MKKLLTILLLIVSTLGYSQPRHYICLAPNVAFETSAKDPKNLIGTTLEVGKYIGTTSVGVVTGYYTLHKQDVYSEVLVTVPISPQTPFTISAGMGWFYYHKEITIEYDINYVFQIKDNVSFIVIYCSQSAFGQTSHVFGFGLNKDF